MANLYLPLVGIVIDSVTGLHGAGAVSSGVGTSDVTTPIIDQITAQQIAGSAMFGTIESMRNNDMNNVSLENLLLYH